MLDQPVSEIKLFWPSLENTHFTHSDTPFVAQTLKLEYMNLTLFYSKRNRLTQLTSENDHCDFTRKKIIIGKYANYSA